MKTLKEHLPHEFLRGEYENTRAYKLRDKLVQRCVDGNVESWPGPQKNVFWWYILEDGVTCVGFNENPSRGWSFPVYKLKR